MPEGISDISSAVGHVLSCQASPRVNGVPVAPRFVFPANVEQLSHPGGAPLPHRSIQNPQTDNSLATKLFPAGRRGPQKRDTPGSLCSCCCTSSNRMIRDARNPGSMWILVAFSVQSPSGSCPGGGQQSLMAGHLAGWQAMVAGVWKCQQDWMSGWLSCPRQRLPVSSASSQPDWPQKFNGIGDWRMRSDACLPYQGCRTCSQTLQLGFLTQFWATGPAGIPHW